MQDNALGKKKSLIHPDHSLQETETGKAEAPYWEGRGLSQEETPPLSLEEAPPLSQQ